MTDISKALDIPLEEFLRPFFDPGETVCLRVFDDRRSATYKGAKLECAAGKIGAMTDTLKEHNEQNRGVYFVINYGGHEDSDITRINAQFVECDTLSFEEQMEQINAFPLPPSMIVKTKKSLMKHEYKTICFDTQGLLGGKLEAPEMDKTLNAMAQEGWELT